MPNVSNNCVRILTFGVRRQPAILNVDRLWDCQHLLNPHAQFSHLNGTDPVVQQFVADDIKHNGRSTQWWTNVLTQVFADCQSAFVNGREPVIAFRCFGGRHRSVACAELCARELRKRNLHVVINHLAISVRS